MLLHCGNSLKNQTYQMAYLTIIFYREEISECKFTVMRKNSIFIYFI